MSHPPRVSLLVCAYNIESYIERCIQSLMQQTLKDIEIIVVNDGSTDKTLETITRISQGDSRITIINQKNKGLSETRKAAFQVATGEYVQFVDGDDCLAPETCATLYHQAKKQGVHAVLFHYIQVYPDGRTLQKQGFTDPAQRQHPFIHFVKGHYFCSVCTKFIQRAFLLEHKHCLDGGITHGEDELFSALFFLQNPDIGLNNGYFYHYHLRGDGTSYNVQGYIRDSVQLCTLVRKAADARQNAQQLQRYCDYYLLSYLRNLQNRSWQSGKSQLAKEISRRVREQRISLTCTVVGKSFLHWLCYSVYARFPGSVFFAYTCLGLFRKRG